MPAETGAQFTVTVSLAEWLNRYRGDYVGSETYNPGDIVSFSSSEPKNLWVCTQQNGEHLKNKQEPINGTTPYWTLLTESGKLSPQS
jgi:hypothetical protein